MRLSFLNSIASILLKKVADRVADLIYLVGDQVPDFFWSLTCLRHVGDLLKTCRRPGFKQVLSKIDVMEFGHNPTAIGEHLSVSVFGQLCKVCACAETAIS